MNSSVLVTAFGCAKHIPMDVFSSSNGIKQKLKSMNICVCTKVNCQAKNTGMVYEPSSKASEAFGRVMKSCISLMDFHINKNRVTKGSAYDD